VGVPEGRVAMVTGAGRLRGIGRATTYCAANVAEHCGYHTCKTCCLRSEGDWAHCLPVFPIAEYITGQSINIDGVVVMW